MSPQAFVAWWQSNGWPPGFPPPFLKFTGELTTQKYKIFGANKQSESQAIHIFGDISGVTCME